MEHKVVVAGSGCDKVIPCDGMTEARLAILSEIIHFIDGQHRLGTFGGVDAIVVFKRDGTIVVGDSEIKTDFRILPQPYEYCETLNKHRDFSWEPHRSSRS